MTHLKPTDKAIRAYYERRTEFDTHNVIHESAVRDAFKDLLIAAGKLAKWTLIPEQRVEYNKARRIVPDATLRDATNLPRGYWEAKDTSDDLEIEIDKKFKKGYPKENIIFEDTRRAVLYQNGVRVGEYALDDPAQIAQLLNMFIGYVKPVISTFEAAVERFRQDAPDLAKGLQEKISEAHQKNRKFQTAYQAFFELCQRALNPNISRDAVDEMLVQHLLTERLMRTVFNNPDFVRRNAIAAEVETVIDALTSQAFNRNEFLGRLAYFYEAIEAAADTLTDFRDKQTFINTVYERFFQGYAVDVADTHGIVYTPQPIVDFMCAAVEEVLEKELGLSLTHPDVHIIDPATGTGNFIVNLLRRIAERQPDKLHEVYTQRLFANEVMLLPYYVAALNIEHTYYELTGTYEPFEGLCFVDTLDLAEGKQMQFAFMSEKNAERVERQKAAPITVIIGNPPYNVGQVNENDNNKNRKYPVIDQRVSETYSKDSKASSKSKLNDAYIKFFRWAADRLQGRNGVVCYVSNNGFVDGIATDGFRKHMLQDFTTVYHLDLHGNVRQNPKLSGTTHNVFGIQVGVGITVALRSSKQSQRQLFYHRVPEYWRSDEKLEFLTHHVQMDGRFNSLNTVEWNHLTPDTRNTWLVADGTKLFESFIPIGKKEGKGKGNSQTIFNLYSLGVSTNRDDVVYDFDRIALNKRLQVFIENYNIEVDRFKRGKLNGQVDEFVDYTRIKWSETLKKKMQRGTYADFDPVRTRISIYRPFIKQYLYYDKALVERPREFRVIFPNLASEAENLVIVTSDIGYRAPQFSALIANVIPDLHLCASVDGHQTFPFYVYDEDGTNRRENITDWALAQFRAHYGDETIRKWDIFYYTYAVLHSPQYRERFAANLRRELPRIPFAPDFWSFAKAGEKLAARHLYYDVPQRTPEYPLGRQFTPGKPVSYHVTKMRLNADKTALAVNDTLTLTGIPPEAFAYRLGNRSALEWVIDQYQITTDKRSGIVSDPNQFAPDDAEYIVRLVGQVVTVSVETVNIVEALPPLFEG